MPFLIEKIWTKDGKMVGQELKKQILRQKKWKSFQKEQIKVLLLDIKDLMVDQFFDFLKGEIINERISFKIKRFEG